jgi:3-deoxy-manno-octulosonate cytidylyltransferase (CMP-KDO synthetase)
MKIIALIPARYAATRFPFKLMQQIGNKSVIVHTYQNTVATGLFDDVAVVTDSEIIFEEITKAGGKAIMSKQVHESGSDRIAEAILDMEADVVINVQGDEPFIDALSLKKLIEAFNDKQVSVASVMKKISNEANVIDVNYVKVVVDKNNKALYFSRSPIPFHRDKSLDAVYFEHIGVYAFRKETLLQFTKWEMTPLETLEKIECLRYLENGVSIKMVLTEHTGVKIDVPEDLAKAQAYYDNITSHQNQ